MSGKARVTLEIAARMLAAIAEGRPVYRACKENVITDLDWIEAQLRDPELAAAATKAEKARAYRYMDEAIEIADTDPDPHRARVRTHVRMTAAARFDRNKFGDQPQPVQLAVSFSGTLDAARARVLTAVKVEALPTPPVPGHVAYCDLYATSTEPAFHDPLEAEGDSIVTRPDKVSRELAEMVRLPATLDDALD